MKAMMNSRISSHYENVEEMKKSRTFGDATGSIQTWSTLGAFENISASGFNKDYEVLAHPESSFDFKNKREVTINWFPIKEVRNDKWIDFTYNHYTRNSIIYAQNFCESDKEQIVQLRIGVSGSVKVWVNDQLVIKDEKETNNGIDNYINEIKLNKGYNRILIQIGSSEIDRSNFLLRITDEKGKSIQGLNFTNEEQDYNKKSRFQGKKIRNPFELYFENKIKENPNKIINHIMLSQSYWKNRKSYKTRKALAEAERLAPKSTYIQILKAYVLSAEDNSSGLSKLLEKLKENDPDSYLALELEYNELIGKEKYEEAEKFADKMETLFGVTEEVFNKKITLAQNNNKMEELKDLINKSYKLYPRSYGMVSLKYAVEKQLNKSPRAYKVLVKYNKKNYNPSALTDLAGNYFDQGNVVKGLSIYQRLSNNHPVAIGYLNTLAKIHFAMQDYSKSIKYYNKCLEIAPYVSIYHEGLGRCFEESGDTELAIESYERAVQLNPNDYDVKEKIRKLQEKDDLFTIFKEVPSPEDLLKNSPKQKDYPEDKSVIVLEENQKIVYKDGASEERSYIMVKMLNPSGVDTWKEYSIGVYGNQRLIMEEAKVYKKDGSKIDAEVNYNQIVFTDLEVGDAIYIVYKLENYNSGKLARHFWDKHYFDYYIPVQHNVYELLIHKDKKFNHAVINSTLKPTKKAYGDFVLYSWKRDNVKAIKSEPYMPPLTDVGAILHISSFQNWNEISEWYTDLAETKQDADFEVKEKVSELFKGKENLTETEKVKIIYNYIINDVRYSSISFRQSGLIPQKASSVINTKLGDCKDVSTLFVTMCKEVGVDANLVLVNTRSEGDKDLHFPSINFNHCIARVKLEKETHYIELTSDLLAFSTIGSSLKNACALNIEKNADLIRINPTGRIQNNIIRIGKISFQGDNMFVEKSTQKGGYFSATMRSTYRDIGVEKQKKIMTEAVQGTYIKTKLKGLKFDSTLTKNEPIINYDYSYTVEDVFNDVGGMYILKLPWADNATITSFLSTETRNYPIALWKYTSRDKEKETITISLPSGKKLMKVPTNIVLHNKYFNYSVKYKKRGNKLELIREFEFNVDEIKPADYKEFKNLYEKVIKSDKKQLAFK